MVVVVLFTTIFIKYNNKFPFSLIPAQGIFFDDNELASAEQ